MTRDDITRMAREAGVRDDGSRFEFSEYKYLERFAVLVAQAEREACAKVCEEIEERCWETWDTQADQMDQGAAIGAAHCAANIRSRGQ